MSPGYLVIDVQQALQKVSPVKAKHGLEIIVAPTTGFEGRFERLFNFGVIKRIKRRIALAVRELESVSDTGDAAHPVVERAVRVLVALAQRELIAHVPGEQLVSARAGQDDLVSPLDLREYVVKWKDH